MLRWLVLAFIVVPIVDLWVLLALGDVLGFWPTLALTVGSGIVGAWLTKREGQRVVRAWRDALERMEPPREGLVDAALVLAGAVLLLTPGVLSDVVGFALLVPFTRRPVASVIRRRIEQRWSVRSVADVAFVDPRAASANPEVVETTGEPVDDES